MLFTEGAQGFDPAKNASNYQVFSVVGGLRGDLLGHDLACIGIVARAKVRRCPARQRNRDRKASAGNFLNESPRWGGTSNKKEIIDNRFREPRSTGLGAIGRFASVSDIVIRIPGYITLGLQDHYKPDLNQAFDCKEVLCGLFV